MPALSTRYRGGRSRTLAMLGIGRSGSLCGAAIMALGMSLLIPSAIENTMDVAFF